MPAKLKDSMKQGLVVIFVVAIIGTVGVYASGSQDKTATLGTSLKAKKTSDSSVSAQASTVKYKDGTYSGEALDSPYGMIQVGAVISGGRITDVKFLQMPNDRGHTQEVTDFSKPLLKQDTLNKQSAHIDFVSGATTTSAVYEQSLQSALDKAAMG